MTEENGRADDELRALARKLGRRGGLKGGEARAAKMTKEERSESARKAAKARWDKKRDGGIRSGKKSFPNVPLEVV